MKLTDQVNDLTKRIGALESEGLDDSSTVARITKIYGDLKITMTISAWLHEYRKCGDTGPLYNAICGTDTFL